MVVIDKANKIDSDTPNKIASANEDCFIELIVVLLKQEHLFRSFVFADWNGEPVFWLLFLKNI